jgi:nucleoside-diphosphate-sugar epimerase
MKKEMLKIQSIQRTRRFLVTGGAGFLGINLIRFLVNKHERVTSLDIADFAYPDVREKINVVQGDIRDKRLLNRVLENVDVVIHAAAALPLYVKKDIYTTNVVGTKNILEISLQKKVGRVIYISSTAVYGIPDHHPLFETDRLSGVGDYGDTKIKAEKICEAYRKKGFCVPILRPKTFIGPERLGVFVLLYDWAKDGRNFPILGSGKNRYQLLDVDDLLQAIYLTSKLPSDKVNETFNIGAEKFGTIKEDFQAVLNHAGFGKKIVTFPSQPVIFFLSLVEKLGLSPLYQWIYQTVAKDSYVSIGKAKMVLGFKPRYSNIQALIRNYEWFIKQSKDLKSIEGVSHRVPWKMGVLQLIKYFF